MRTSVLLVLGVVLGMVLALPPAFAHDTGADPSWLASQVAWAMDNGILGALGLALGSVVLGALHGLEPGHAKTMMSAFIVAIRGTVGQAVLLGGAATASHTAVIWIVVLPLVAFSGTLNLAATTPWLQLVSAVLILAVAGWTLAGLRPRRIGVADPTPRQPMAGGAVEGRLVETGRGLLKVRVVESDPPRLRVQAITPDGRPGPAEHVRVSLTDRAALNGERVCDRPRRCGSTAATRGRGR